MRNPDDILAAPGHVRKRLRLDKKPKRYAKEQRGPFDRDTLLRHLRGTGIRSWRKYQSARNHGDPTVYDYRKEFDSWTKACEVAFGKDLVEVKKLDHKYIYETLLTFNIWTLAEYEKKRAKFPDILPSKHRLMAEWTRWSNVKECAKRHSLKLLLDEYIKLGRRLGKKPTLADCREAGLVIDKAIQFYKGKKGLDDMVASMRRHE